MQGNHWLVCGKLSDSRVLCLHTQTSPTEKVKYIKRMQDQAETESGLNQHSHVVLKKFWCYYDILLCYFGLLITMIMRLCLNEKSSSDKNFTGVTNYIVACSSCMCLAYFVFRQNQSPSEQVNEMNQYLWNSERISPELRNGQNKMHHNQHPGSHQWETKDILR